MKLATVGVALGVSLGTATNVGATERLIVGITLIGAMVGVAVGAITPTKAISHNKCSKDR